MSYASVERSISMNIIDFFRAEQKRVHAELRFCVSDLTTDEWHYMIPGTGNHIAFLMWHIVRTEDGVLRALLQERRPIWNEARWHERLGLPIGVQGTGMSTEEAHALRINDPALFMEYAEQVWREFEEYLAAITDGGALLSERLVTVRVLGREMYALPMIGEICVSHLFMHLGEITLLRGAMGKQGFRF
jgi:hypothetical protein